jgi:hypothetical protein
MVASIHQLGPNAASRARRTIRRCPTSSFHCAWCSGASWPIVPCDVRLAVPHAVGRKPWYDGGKDRSVSLEQALDASTGNAAETDSSTAIKGKLEPGMVADLTVLSGDVHALENPEAPQPDILRTICDGRITWDGRKPA